MREIRKVVVIGTGAIGAAYASRIYDMNSECLKVVADKARIERYSRNGFFINDKRYDFNYVEPNQPTEPADLVVIAVKFHNLNQAIKNIKNFVGSNTIIISLLNGISSEELVGKEFGMNRILYAICVGIDAVRNNNKIKFSRLGEIVFGEENNKSYSDKVVVVKNFFDQAQIPYEIPEDMIRELWWKFMVNVGVNQTSAILGASYGVFQNIEEAYDLMISAMKEVMDIAQNLGINLNEDDLIQWCNVLKNLSKEGKTSMLQDIEAGRKTEVEIFAGTVCELGEKYGVPTPVNRTLFNMIRTLEKKQMF